MFLSSLALLFPTRQGVKKLKQIYVCYVQSREPKVNAFSLEIHAQISPEIAKNKTKILFVKIKLKQGL